MEAEDQAFQEMLQVYSTHVQVMIDSMRLEPKGPGCDGSTECIRACGVLFTGFD
jgi:hypothetical protein